MPTCSMSGLVRIRLDRARVGQPQLVQRTRLILGERLGGVEVQRASRAVVGQRVQHGQVEGQRLAAGRARGHDRVLLVGLQGVGLVGVPALDPVALERLHPELRAALERNGIEGLYAHQADALESAYQQDTIVTTGTASGKSLAFNLPVLDTLAHDRSARALYLYPTKALAQDQARALHKLGLPYLRPAIYDGDTPREERRAIRGRSNLILTNPDMLHVGMLPNHQSWGDLLANLAWIVVDEAHVYRGVFGSHVANVLRRLARVALAYGTEPRFVLASATIANPVELAERLTGREVALVDRDGAPRAERRIAMWNPPLVDERTGARASPLAEAADLLADLVEQGVRTICFLKSRRGVELILRFARDRLEQRGRADLAELISPYRAGYTPAQRRE